MRLSGDPLVTRKAIKYTKISLILPWIYLHSFKPLHFNSLFHSFSWKTLNICKGFPAAIHNIQINKRKNFKYLFYKQLIYNLNTLNCFLRSEKKNEAESDS